MVPTDAQATNEMIDLLDRQPFINQMITVTESLSSRKKNACYAINGAWGVGKSFVISEYENQLKIFQQEESVLSKYLLFHYDCWKYDYYTEPLTAIVAVMLETIETNVDLVPIEVRQRFVGTAKAVGLLALDQASHHIKDKTGINFKTLINALTDINNEAVLKIAESHDYDEFYEFRKIIDKLRDSIRELAINQTVIIVVDELDRCLPTYTIQVLERLHHVFSDIPNVQVILSIDKKQLGHIVTQIYGSNTSPNQYLAKFIQFELTLSEGNVNDNFSSLFYSYTSKFTLEAQYKHSTFIETLLSGIDTRTRISIINRCELIHSLLPENFTSSATTAHMCAEIFLTTIKHFGLTLHSGPSWDNDPLSMGIGLHKPNREIAEHTGIYTINDSWHKNFSTYCHSYDRIKSCDTGTISGLILACYWHICGVRFVDWVSTPYALHQPDFEVFIDDFWKLLAIIH